MVYREPVDISVEGVKILYDGNCIIKVGMDMNPMTLYLPFAIIECGGRIAYVNREYRISFSIPGPLEFDPPWMD